MHELGTRAAARLPQPAVASARRISAEELCERYTARVYRFAAMVSRGPVDAEDLAQDALERALRALDRFDPERGPIEAWLWRIVVNAARDAGRVARRDRLLAQALVAVAWRPPDRLDAPPGVSDGDLLEAVRQLHPRQRAVIALRFGADLDHASVGRALGVSAAAATMTARRALAALRRRLEANAKEANGKEQTG